MQPRSHDMHSSSTSYWFYADRFRPARAAAPSLISAKNQKSGLDIIEAQTVREVRFIKDMIRITNTPRPTPLGH
jgi:hypothetical protein